MLETVLFLVVFPNLGRARDPTEHVGPAWPAATEAAGATAWAAGKQPTPLSNWTKDNLGKPVHCWSTAVIEETPSWPGVCLGLTKQDGVTTLNACAAGCIKNALCPAWQKVKNGACYHGLGNNCWGRDGDQLDVEGAQRFQHGAVRLLKNLVNISEKSYYIYGLKPLGQYTTTNTTATPIKGRERCRLYCYSNIKCQYWQFDSEGCHVEDPDAGFVVPYPLTLTSGVAISSSDPVSDNPASKLIAGEFIQHYCPETPSGGEEAMTALHGEEETRSGWNPWAVGVVLIILVPMFGLAIFQCFCKGQKRHSKRSVRAQGIGYDARSAESSTPGFAGTPDVSPLMMPMVPTPPTVAVPNYGYTAAAPNGWH